MTPDPDDQPEIPHPHAGPPPPPAIPTDQPLTDEQRAKGRAEVERIRRQLRGEEPRP